MQALSGWTLILNVDGPDGTRQEYGICQTFGVSSGHANATDNRRWCRQRHRVKPFPDLGSFWLIPQLKVKLSWCRLVPTEAQSQIGKFGAGWTIDGAGDAQWHFS